MQGITFYPTHVVAACAGAEVKLPAKGKDVTPSAEEAEALPVAIKLLLVMSAQAGVIRFPDADLYKSHLFPAAKSFLDYNGGFNAAGIREYRNDPVLAAAAELHKAAKQKSLSVGNPSVTGLSVVKAPNSESGPSAPPIPAPRNPGSQTESFLESWYQGQPVSWVRPEELTPHPFNSTIYDVKPDAELLASVRLYGVLVPLVITTEKMILGGQCRQTAAIEVGHTSVPAIITNAPAELHELLIIHLNRQRHKSPIVKIREFIALRERAALEAELRQKAGKHLMENFPQGIETGAARDHAAKDSGYSGRTMADAAKAYEEAMRRKDARLTPDEVAKVLAKLDEDSFSGACKLACSFGWFEEQVKKKRTPPSPKGKNVSETDSNAPKTEIEKRIDGAVSQVSEDGKRTAFEFAEIVSAVGDGVAKAQIKRWLDKHIAARKITSLKGGLYFCVTRERLIDEKQDLDEEYRTISDRLKQINAQLEEIGDQPWRPL